MTTTFGVPSRAAPASRMIAAAIVLVGALALAGCGGSAGTPAPGTAAPEATAAATAPAGAASSDPGTGSCGAATAALVEKTLTSPAIVRVSVDGGCHDAWIETTLDKSTVREALAICDAAARIAYGDEISSITVTGNDEVELSIGIKGQDCIGEP